MDEKLSLHDLESGKRLTQHGLIKDVKFLYYNTWKTRFLPRLKPWVSSREVI